MSTLDTVLLPDNSDGNNNNKKKKEESTKSRLQGLKEMLQADPVQLNTDSLQANTLDFPASQQAKYIDYDDEKKNHKEFAKQVIDNIIDTYVTFELSPRQQNLKDKDIMKYSRLLLLVQISEDNLIKIQESIDGGDMSKEMFDSVNKAQKELRDNMDAEEKHLDKCEKYWCDYAASYGLQNTEEKIVQENEIKDDSQKKHIIMDMSRLAEQIQEQLQKEKEKNKSQE